MSDVPTRLLRETLRGRMQTTPGCVDADTLAAWSDGTLSARERTAVESHASDCVRCQALLAAMARTTLPAQGRRWWRTARLGWLVPLTAAAVAVVVWINVPKTTVVPSPLRAGPNASADRPAESRDAVTPPRQARADEKRLAANGSAAQSTPQLQAQANAAPTGAREAAPAPAPAAPASSEADTALQIAARESAAGSARDAPAAAQKSQASARALADVATSVARPAALAKMEPARAEVVSPNPNIRWRLLTRGSVERSIDGGATWQTQSTGAAVTLTAGVAPAPTICWLVGPGGIVVVSIDGRTWQRVQIPEAIDLTSISASDAANATVTAADGRAFTTLDGGKTWGR